MFKVKDCDIEYTEHEKIKEILARIYEVYEAPGSGGKRGIGELGEKIFHRAVKYYIEPDEGRHEITVGSYVADIMRDGEVTEIQTGSFRSMYEKNKFYIAKPDIKSVTVVYPVRSVRHLCWVDKETGELSKSTRSPKFNDIYVIYPEIYYLKDFLASDKFTLKIILTEVTEMKYLDGWSKNKKAGATKIDAIPISVIKVLTLSGLSGCKRLFPPAVTEMPMFTAKDLAQFSQVSGRPLYSFLRSMRELGVIRKEGKKGNSDIYIFTV